ncbi:hypothetical protein PVAP13_1NG277419 [Panicum virgatum]|uniref:Uncharacterized protein n=1 Tax=Panicum virgatum TaxID=38727 RepID=A0A8T0X6U6_PANVG|nr:hypothetical protein PVAP13_1NG277419 [Panicum virgatum]
MPIPLTDETITALMFDMLGAGSDTASTTLNWAMMELIRSPAAMAKAQAEVREAFKGKSIITEDDLANRNQLPQTSVQRNPKAASYFSTPDPTSVSRDLSGHGLRYPQGHGRVRERMGDW